MFWYKWAIRIVAVADGICSRFIRICLLIVIYLYWLGSENVKYYFEKVSFIVLCQRQKQHYRMKRALVITEPQGDEFFSFAVKFRLIHLPEVWILGTPDSEDCKRFPVNTVLCYTQVPFKTGLTVIWQIRIWLFLYERFKRLNRI
jgi:hypothetical protein